MPVKYIARQLRALVTAAALASAAFAQPAPTDSASQPVTPDTVLIQNATAQVTKRDFDFEVAQLPPDSRAGVVNNKRRIGEIVGRLLVMKTLAHEARTQGLDRDADVAAKLALETDRLYAQVRQSKLDEQAANEFDAKHAQWEARARELYAVERARFVAPEQVSASHILFSTQQHTSDEAKKLAQEARARIVAGADFSELAKALSEDPTAKQNGGNIGYFGRSDVHPAFAAAAFALAKPGDVSEPVQTSFGWHLIRLDGRKPAAQRSFDDVRDQIIAELKQKFITDRREAMLGAIGKDASVKPNVDALEALYVRPASEEELRRATSQGPAGATPPAR